jgi:low affinity Fe/Cu permease
MTLLMTSEDPRFGRRVLRHLGSVVASTATTTVVAVLFLGGMVASLLVSDERWMTRVQTVASVLALVLLFALHHTQHRDQIAMQRKLDELLNAHEDASDDVIRLEAASDAALDEIDERQGDWADR